MQSQRDRLDRPQVRGDVIADLAVAPGGAFDEDALLIAERNSHPINLGFQDVRHRIDAQAASDPLVEGDDVLLAVGVVDREHRHAMPDGLEVRQRRAAHPLRGRIRRDQLRVLLLQPAKLIQQQVVIAVG